MNVAVGLLSERYGLKLTKGEPLATTMPDGRTVRAAVLEMTKASPGAFTNEDCERACKAVEELHGIEAMRVMAVYDVGQDLRVHWRWGPAMGDLKPVYEAFASMRFLTHAEVYDETEKLESRAPAESGAMKVQSNNGFALITPDLSGTEGKALFSRLESVLLM